MGYFDKIVIKELFSTAGLVVGEIDLDKDEYIANILIEVSPVGLYSPREIGLLADKIKKLETELIAQGFIHDIKFGDLYMGSWRVIAHFLDEDEIKEWEENAIKSKSIG